MKLRQLIEKYSFFLNVSILVLNVVILAILIYGYLRFSANIWALSSDLAKQRISNNIDIPPDWLSFGWYITDTFHEGMSRNEVYQELDKISAYTISIAETEFGNYCEIIEFRGVMGHTHYPIWFCYENEVLEHYTIAIDD